MIAYYFELQAANVER